MHTRSSWLLAVLTCAREASRWGVGEGRRCGEGGAARVVAGLRRGWWRRRGEGEGGEGGAGEGGGGEGEGGEGEGGEGEGGGGEGEGGGGEGGGGDAGGDSLQTAPSSSARYFLSSATSSSRTAV